MHSATKALLGRAGYSGSDVSDFNADPATFLAGLAVRVKNSSGQPILGLALADGQYAGISLGRSLSNTKRTSVARTGYRVPVLVERQPARGIITITSYANLVSGTDDSITVGATVFTAQAGAATPGDATFQAATSNDATAASLAAQINAHATAGALVIATAVAAVVTVTAILNTTAADTIALAYTDGDANIGATVSGATLTDSDATPDYLTIGSKVYFSDTTGKADDPNSDSTISDAIYVSGLITVIDEDGTEQLGALIDFPGGL
jgi:hypothetical protein